MSEQILVSSHERGALSLWQVPMLETYGHRSRHISRFMLTEKPPVFVSEVTEPIRRTKSAVSTISSTEGSLALPM